MNTNVIQGSTEVEDQHNLHPELSKAADKQTNKDLRALRNAGFGQTLEGMAITSTYVDRVAAKVTEKLTSKERKHPNSNDFKLERLLRQLKPELIALALLQMGLHCSSRGDIGTQRAACSAIGQALNNELWAAKLLQTSRKLHRRVNKYAKERRGSLSGRDALAKKAASDAGFSMQEWTNPMLLHAGQWGLNVLLEAIPDVLEIIAPKGFKGQWMLRVTDEGVELAKEALAESVCKTPVYQPRTEAPQDWTQFYMRVAEDDRTLDRAQLLRTRHKDVISAATFALRNGQMAPAVRAVNTLQSVPWTINTWIMDVERECFERGIVVEGLPTKKPLVVPQRLPQAEFDALSVEERRLLSKSISGLRRANNINRNDTMMFIEDMEIAARFATAERFHTPMNMDWRGRVYSLTNFNFARQDYVRALFLFANGEPIGERGLYWLKIHVANCGDFDKVSKKPMEDRIAWVDQNLELITDYARRPLYNTGWTKADSPFLFLAACRELVSALSVGPAYISHVPVSFDGSCNGLQHLCAMTRSTEGKLVNLTDDPKVYDVYQIVADITKRRIEADLGDYSMFGKVDDEDPKRKTIASLHSLAMTALSYGVDRSLVKRNVMTFAYSSKEYGMSDQHFVDTMEPLELKVLKGELKDHPFGETRDEWKLACRYIAKRTLASIKEVVALPAQAMGFMQDIAQALAHEGEPVRWTSPAGVPCINRYHESTTERLELFLYDKGVKVRTQVKVAVGFEKEINKDKAASAISPNVVHSMDAAALLLTVCACAEASILNIATVHDSFGCLPSQADRFNEIIRAEFARMYTDHDVLAELLESARADLTPANHHRLPSLPEKGKLNLEEILRARYAFA